MLSTSIRASVSGLPTSRLRSGASVSISASYPGDGVEHDARPSLGAGRPGAVIEGLAGGADGRVEVAFGRHRQRGDGRLVGRVESLRGVAAACRTPSAVDEEVILLGFGLGGQLARSFLRFGCRAYLTTGDASRSNGLVLIASENRYGYSSPRCRM